MKNSENRLLVSQNRKCVHAEARKANSFKILERISRGFAPSTTDRHSITTFFGCGPDIRFRNIFYWESVSDIVLKDIKNLVINCNGLIT